jgi:anti-sigma B factor antagonist
VARFAGTKVFLDEDTTLRVQDWLLDLADELNKEFLILDFGNVEYLSSMALGTLIRLHKKLIAAGRHLRVVNLSREIFEVFRVTRLDKLLELKVKEHQDEQGALTGNPQSLTTNGHSTD